MQYRPGDLLHRVEESLESARSVFERFQPSDIEEMKKSGGDPVTAADLELDRILKKNLLGAGEGWLSEETADDRGRLDRDLVWIVDPLDGTREFIDGLPEFCVSVAAVVSGAPVAGGILNPAADLTIVGALDEGVRCNGEPTRPRKAVALEEMTVLASRSEWNRGEWQVVEDLGMRVVPMGSVAYKFARVAAGLDDATWTPVPKHEWDLAGGAALLVAAGGSVLDIDGHPMPFNSEIPWVSGAIAVPPAFDSHVDDVIELIRKQNQAE